MGSGMEGGSPPAQSPRAPRLSETFPPLITPPLKDQNLQQDYLHFTKKPRLGAGGFLHVWDPRTSRLTPFLWAKGFPVLPSLDRAEPQALKAARPTHPTGYV